MPKKQLSIIQRRWLRFAHLFFASLWGGGAVTMVLLFCIEHPQTVARQVELTQMLLYMDFLIVGLGAAGCLVTGVLYSIYGNYGFFKFRWVILKYAVNITFILYGSFVFLPFTHSQYRFYSSLPPEMAVPEESLLMNLFCTGQNFCTIAMFLLVIYISVFKPFKKEKAAFSSMRDAAK